MDKRMLSNVEAILQSLVAIQSVSGDTALAQAVHEFVKDSLQNYPIYTQEFNDGGYPILLITTQPTLTPQTLFVAHSDVVPSQNQALFSLRSDKSRLYGRGVWDMKFAIAAYI